LTAAPRDAVLMVQAGTEKRHFDRTEKQRLCRKCLQIEARLKNKEQALASAEQRTSAMQAFTNGTIRGRAYDAAGTSG
jgi:hypothetical protein